MDRNPGEPHEALSMNVCLKITSAMLAAIREDLGRRHAFAHERVGFLTAGASALLGPDLLLTARTYRPVDEEDYMPDPSVGVKIGPGAMRKALQAAYRPPAAILHIHTHGGCGRQHFSGVDKQSAGDFVPSFFNVVPRMPHGIVVLSDDCANGLLWLGPDHQARSFVDIVAVGAPLSKYGDM
ncbi:hypothetical protein [Asticcacaulis machinosus]|uniref:JAB domain-containing protein n=1 Tax=Asticcacaulis machinosus TaxID=2984211 RepID=A0ABT5HGC6_9CAUL|nr:hypothetical protein [Asticcacaulis machinosus]MDC7675190.1 hypothetical protein [Asticcacaulis machinosus]